MVNQEKQQPDRDLLKLEYQEAVTHSRFIVATRFNYFASFTTFFFILVGGFYYAWIAKEDVLGEPLKSWIMLLVVLFGFYMVTVALFLEHRATQLYRAADNRAAELERLMGIENGIRQILIMPGRIKKFLGIPITHTTSIRMFYRLVALIWIIAMIFSICRIWILI